jgi:hypothetical protein
LISPSDPHFFPFFFGNNRVRCKPRRFIGGPFPVRPIRVYAFHSLANPAILFEHGNGKVAAPCRPSGNLALPPYPFGDIRQAAYILVRKPRPIRYPHIFGAQRGGTAIEISAVHTHFSSTNKKAPSG